MRIKHSYTKNNCILVIGEQKQIQMQNITMETQILEDLVRGRGEKQSNILIRTIYNYLNYMKFGYTGII